MIAVSSYFALQVGLYNKHCQKGSRSD